jgi:hypothetical protein
VSDRTIVFLTHKINNKVLKSFNRLVDEVGSKYDVYFVFHGDGPPNIKVDHLMNISNSDLLDLPYELKINRDKFSIIPGNADLFLQVFSRRIPCQSYWVVEYDVYFSGNWSYFFEYFDNNSDSDLLTSTLLPKADSEEWLHWRSLRAADEIVEPAHQVRSFLPVHRVSRRLLELVDDCYRRGWAGHYEATLPTIALHHGLAIEDFGGEGPYTKPANINRFYWNTPNSWGLSPGTFTYRPVMRFRPVKLMWPLSSFVKRKYEPNKLWHPVKG